MKNILKIRSLVIAFSLVAFTSCSDDFFEQDAGVRITPDKHYNSVEDNISSMYGVLVPLQDAMPNYILVDGLLSDEMLSTKNADVYMRELEEHTFSPQNPYINASDFYKSIININEVLSNIDKVSKLRPMDFNAYQLHYTKGGLIGLRAWIYLALVRTYGKAALISDNLSKLPNGNAQNMLSKEVMIDTLINQMLPYMYYEDSNDLAEYAIDQYSNTKAIVGELYLEKNDYANAVSFLKGAVESFKSSMIYYSVEKKTSKENWKNIFKWSEGFPQEKINILMFNILQNQTNILTEWTLYNDKYTIKPSDVLVNTFNAQFQIDGTTAGDKFRGEGASFATIPGSTNKYIFKYAVDAELPYNAPIMILRAGDLHLLLAEALNRNGESDKALVLINDGFSVGPRPSEYAAWSPNIGIRGRANLAPKTLDPSITGNAAVLAIEDMIIEERALELAFEGKRWTDLVRIAKRRNDPSYLANKVASKFADPAKASRVKNKLMDPANWYIPIY